MCMGGGGDVFNTWTGFTYKRNIENQKLTDADYKTQRKARECNKWKCYGKNNKDDDICRNNLMNYDFLIV